MSLQISRRGKLYVKAEGSYGDATVTFASGDAMRHIDFDLQDDPFGRVKSTEKKASPGTVNAFDRRRSASWSLKDALLRPSGTINTIPESDVVQKAAFGTETNVALTTAVGVKPPVAVLSAVDGLVDNGAHSYRLIFADASGHTKVSGASNAVTTATTGNGKVTVTIALGPTGTVSRGLYRTAAGADPAVVANYKLHSTIADNTTVTVLDNTADSGLGAAPTNTDLSTLLTTKAAFLAAVSTLAVGDGLLITRGGVNYVRVIATISGNNVTWLNALPSAVVDGDVVQGTITYKLTTDLALSMAFFHTEVANGGSQGFTRLGLGCVADKWALKFSPNEEVHLSVSGPAQKQLVSGTPGVPASFTTVGGNPPSGLIGDLWIGDNVYLHTSADCSVTNGMKLRNAEAGNSGVATEAYQAGRRDVMFNLDAYVETEATLYDLAVAGTLTPVLKQVGRTAGNIIAVYCPSVDFKVASTSDGDNEATWSWKGTARETVDGQNDELVLVLA